MSTLGSCDRATRGGLGTPKWFYSLSPWGQGCHLGLSPSVPTGDHARFKHSLSRTFVAIDQSYTLSYGFGDVSVALGRDTVTVSDPEGLGRGRFGGKSAKVGVKNSASAVK